MAEPFVQGNVTGALPAAQQAMQIPNLLPNSMLSAGGEGAYPVSNVLSGSIQVPPFPPPPPAPSIGTIAGPPAPSQLPAIVDVAGKSSSLSRHPSFSTPISIGVRSPSERQPYIFQQLSSAGRHLTAHLTVRG